MNCGVVCRHGWDPLLLWLWHRPVATAPIRTLARELPCAMGCGPRKSKKTKKKEKKKRKPSQWKNIPTKGAQWHKCKTTHYALKYHVWKPKYMSGKQPKEVYLMKNRHKHWLPDNYVVWIRSYSKHSLVGLPH